MAQIEEINKRNEDMKCSIENSLGAMIKEMVVERAKMQKRNGHYVQDNSNFGGGEIETECFV